VRCGLREVIGSSKVVSKRVMVSYVLAMVGHMPPKFQSMLLADGQFYPAIIGQFHAAIDKVEVALNTIA